MRLSFAAALLAGLVALSTTQVGEARVNSTGAIGTFLIVDCETCTKDDDSIFCTNAKADTNFVKNATYRVTIRDKKIRYGAADGSKYCWSGEFRSYATVLWEKHRGGCVR